ncbi:MAG: TIGR00282 family metallophosphoesterase [Clostridia bacterium]|nr:TIGR00282 family metallophosphoesterase [Clostridia bacterium]
MTVKILVLGDVVGETGTNYICRPGFLGGIKKEYGIDLIIANGENSAKGNGLSPESANTMFDAGVDVITGGNHTWQKSSVYTMLDDDARLVRPANFPGAAPGHGSTVIDVKGCRVLVFNLSGNAFMLEPVASCYEWADKILESEAGNFDISVLDFHAETTSEKIAMGWYLDGRVSAVYGTHTHVQTADARVLPKGTGYVTDVGMCGSMNGVLGIKTECILHKFIIHTPVRFEEAKGDEAFHGAVFEIDAASGKCLSVETVIR